MTTVSSTKEIANPGATAVITHRVRDGRSKQYEEWLTKIRPECEASPGHLDWHIVRPIPGITGTYTIIIRFDTRGNLQQWMESPTRVRLIEAVQPLLVTGDDFFINSGLDFWFVPSGAKSKVPVRWKQYLITWSAIYPLAIGVPLAIDPVLSSVRIFDSHYVKALVVSGLVVFLMVYVVMPRYTKLVGRWLFSRAG